MFHLLKKIAEYFSIGKEAFEKFLVDNNLKSPIRVWPHHFDLGIYASLNENNNLFLGAGLAIPDTLVDDLYYYAAGWKNGASVVTKDFSGLSIGTWRSDWDGATLAASAVKSNDIRSFLEQVIGKLTDE